MFEIEISRSATLDFQEACRWYEEQRIGLGDDLGLCFEESVEILRRFPLFEIRYKNLRLLNIRRFPYQIIYQILGERIVVIAFFHAHRDPSIWKSRAE